MRSYPVKGNHNGLAVSEILRYRQKKSLLLYIIGLCDNLFTTNFLIIEKRFILVFFLHNRFVTYTILECQRLSKFCLFFVTFIGLIQI